jgi:hypothetical protein
MGDVDPGLRFDRAEYSGRGVGTSAAPCGICKRPIEGQYWKCQGHLVCGSCRPVLATKLATMASGGSLGKALVQGGGMAVLCGIGYAIFSAVTKMELALITIGIGFLVAKAVRKASGGIGGRRFQVLAVALTYLGSTMGYMPAVFNGLMKHADHASPANHANHAQEAPSASPPAAPGSEPVAGDGAGGPSATPAPPAAATPKMNPFIALLALGALIVAISLAGPFLEFTQAPLGLLIVGFGLWEAWRLTRAIPVVIEGPYQLAPATAAPPS